MKPRTWSAPLLLALLLASRAYAEPPKIAITGPATVIAGSAVFLQLDTDATAIEWVVCPQSAQANLIGLTLYQGQRPDGSVILKYAAFFSSPTPGTYTFVVVGCKQDQLGKAVHTLTNGTPSPDPPVPPVPPVPGERFVLVVAESSERTVEQAETINGLASYLSSKKHQYRVVDPDLKDNQTGKTPAWLTPYLEAIAKAKVAQPALLVASVSEGGSTVIAVVPLPDTAEAAIAEVKKHGG